MLDLIVGIFGLVAGGILSFIAVEELAAGRRYFIFMKRMLLLLISLTIFYMLKENIPLLIVFFLAASTLFILEFYWTSSWKEIGNYVFAIAGYVSSFKHDYHLLLPTFLFLYGLPTGTLLWQARKIWKKR